MSPLRCLFAFLLAGCSNGGGGSDAAVDVAGDGPSADAAVDTGNNSSCSYETEGGPASPCGTCSGGDLCCVSNSGTQCVPSAPSCSGIALGCIKPSDCSAGFYCCAGLLTVDDGGCPFEITPPLTTSCAPICNTSTNACASDVDCPFPKVCKAVSTPGTTFRMGLCL